MLLYLWEHHGAPKLNDHVAHFGCIRPSNVCATLDETRAILAHASPALMLWIAFCSDLAIRSGTAAILSGKHYDPMAQVLRFVTKKNARVTTHVTAEIAAILAECDQSAVPFTYQLRCRYQPVKGKRISLGFLSSYHSDALHTAFRKARAAAGLARVINPHDMRRGAAVRIYRMTRDLYKAKALLGHSSMASTIWYLDHDLETIDRETLEALKLPERKTA